MPDHLSSLEMYTRQENYRPDLFNNLGVYTR